ncbi:DUF6585 family protein [Ktedonospora formicarum]|uniref:Uncharacterized protein n=1 Tax=Ktedonospora formicarum TaxID=2778364 RepID=A0A8J3I9W3_9CHLR|nr:DUF6585 family protein [Ktedonospora formicarum]GHO48423.1 hypothetical protein KSX_65860 [Ktedonospora formicarum]
MKAVEPLSPRAYQVAEAYNLGEPRAEFLDKKPFYWLSALKLLGLGIFIVLTARYILPLYSGADGLIVVVEVLGSLSIICGFVNVGFVVKQWVQGDPCYYLCAGGLVVATTKRIKDVLLWKDMLGVQRHLMVSPDSSITNAAPDPPSYKFVLLTKTGRRYILEDSIGSQLSYSLMEALWPETLERYLAGRVLTFGDLVLDTEGLRLTSGGFLPWREAEMPWFDEVRGTLVISRSNDTQHWAVLPLHEILNVDLCLQLIEYVLQDIAENAEG